MAIANLNWVTPQGSIGNIAIGINASVTVLAVDTNDYSAPLVYILAEGVLPPGLSLNSTNGVISGTPVYTIDTGDYFKSLTYNFTIICRNGTSQLTGNFKIIISNTVNTNFIWITAEGSLGTVPNGEFYALPLQAVTNPASIITYEVISGELPPGMQVIKSDIIFNSNVLTTYTQTIANVLTLTDSVSIPIGAIVTGANIPANTIVDGVDASNKTVTLSANTTSLIAAGSSINFYAVQFTAGTLVGVPTILTATTVGESQLYRFSIRAATNSGQVNDRSFSLSVTNVFAPIIEPFAAEQFNLGSYFDGSYVNQQLTVTELNPNAQIAWDVSVGVLPPGLVLDAGGLLSGYLTLLQLVGDFGPANYDGDTITGELIAAGNFNIGLAYVINNVGNTNFVAIGAQANTVGVEFIATGIGSGSGTAYASASAIITGKQQYNKGPYEFAQSTQNATYNFTIRAFDGANYDLQQYSIGVVSRVGFTADSSTEINNTYLTVDSLNTYPPILRNTSLILPTARQNGYYAFKFDGYDFQGDTLLYGTSSNAGTFDNSVIDPFDFTLKGFDYELFDSSVGAAGANNLQGLVLDADTGWLYGKLDPQISAVSTYQIGITVSKIRDGITRTSSPQIFSLTVLGDVNNTVNWITPGDLGYINNGSISELTVLARSTEGKTLYYTLVDAAGVSCRLPQGLELLPMGEISGRVSFEAFSVDDYATTFDNNTLTIDRNYTFFVIVADSANLDTATVSSVREFTLKLNIINEEPHDDLYLQAMPAFDQRQLYQSVINSDDIFPPDLIYRATDPYFGKQSKIRMLFAAGLTADELNTYETAIVNNHYFKSFTFGEIKTAVVLDELFRVKYEVVYIDVLDPQENAAGVSPGLEIDLTGVITNPYINPQGVEYKIVYPNATDNMLTRLETTIGYQDRSSLPPWMTSNQLSASSTAFRPPIGFTKAVVMAYTVAGAGKLIAYRLQNSGINFNNIQFTVDRYQTDTYYSTNYNVTTGMFNSGAETVFDTLPVGTGAVVATVNYGITVTPFNQIDGQTVSYINLAGGIDGNKTWANGDTIVFLRQEQFAGNPLYDGWYRASTSTIIPGYLEKVIGGSSVVNQRGGVWQISITNDVVTLEFLQEIELNSKIQILDGATYSTAVVYYAGTITPGLTVPHYTVFGSSLLVNEKTRTTFNNNTTRFFSNRDQYYEPGTQDQYLKFPQDGVFK